ncbi:MAG TPA: AAA family ATPase [Candidatus Binatia bacterium]|nr:AAA family ATPase [Candidatus Binatia bacterium]
MIRTLETVEVPPINPLCLERIRWLASRYVTGRGLLLAPHPIGGQATAGAWAALGDLTADLELQGQTRDLEAMLNAHRDLSGTVPPRSLVHHYIALQAVTLAAAAGSARGRRPAQPAQVRDLVLVAVRHLEMGRIILVLVGGEPGAGTSTVARAVAQRWGSMLLCTGLAEAPDEQVLDLAGHALRTGQGVVVDLAGCDPGWRRRAARMAEVTHSDCVQLSCTASAQLRTRRLAQRAEDRSGITSAAGSATRQITTPWVSWPEATLVDTGQTLEHSLATVSRAIARSGEWVAASRRPWPRRSPSG